MLVSSPSGEMNPNDKACFLLNPAPTPPKNRDAQKLLSIVGVLLFAFGMLEARTVVSWFSGGAE